MRRLGLTGRCAALLPWLLVGATAAAEPLGLIDRDGGFVDVFNVGYISGLHLATRRQPWIAIGTTMEGSPEELLANKSYTAAVGQLGNADDVFEVYYERPTIIATQMASAVANAAGDLEVGVDGFHDGLARSIARFALTIKNYRSRPVQLDFAFTIPAALGDPFDLAERGGSIELVERFARTVPAPATAWLVELAGTLLAPRLRRSG